MSAAQKRLSTLLLIAVAMAVAAATRSVGAARLRTESGAWKSVDPDSLYHMRRVDRALTEGTVRGEDALLAHPRGASIPWPPYYTRVATLLTGPWLKDSPRDTAETRRASVERSVATLPLVFGTLTTGVVGLAGALVGGPPGAAAAGLTYALAGKAVAYAGLGNGDHHAFVSLCLALAGWLLSRALARGALDRPGVACGHGAAVGGVAGVAVGSWVGALAYVVLIELVFAACIVARAWGRAGSERPLAPLAALGLAFHAFAAATLAPAVLASPWRHDSPWMVVNLSWFHLGFLAVGATVFLPLFFLRGSRAAVRAYPVAVALGLTLLAAFLLATDFGPGEGLREAFAWAGRTDAFMARVAESDPVWQIGPARVFEALGGAVFLLPFAWIVALLALVRGGWEKLTPWVVWTPVLALQGALQQRFLEPLAVPLAVLTGWGIATLLDFRAAKRGTGRDGGPGRLARLLPVGLSVLLAAGLQWPTIASSLERARALRAAPPPPEQRGLRAAVREACDWLRASSPPGDASSARDDGVLAAWQWGHFIEWAAERPSVATNFGSYVGSDSFLAPSHFFLARDDAAAEAMLVELGVRHVLVTTHLLAALPTLIQALPRETWGELVEVRPGSDDLGAARPELARTVGARLSRLELDGARPDFEHVPFLRLVHVSRARDGRPEVLPIGGRPPRMVTLWEHVPGVVLEARGTPGERLEARVRVEFAAAGFQLPWRATATADADGVARVRVPYATDRPAGDGRASGPLSWRFGEKSGRLELPEADIRAGATRNLP